ncbi:uncharacterized protein BDW70DRAFT_140298 [Aspergillus foveolatus]|uniref:uncharacterized protein n=1 Tax=Aspergillus foveolatus TaxID=210207 RepID=UPI003CCD941B
MPREPWQRIPGDALESLLREQCDRSPLIKTRYEWTITGVAEHEADVKVTVLNPNEESSTIRSSYVVRCDGASSTIRMGLSIPLDGGPLAGAAVLVHFKSRDLAKLHRQGTFGISSSPAILSPGRTPWAAPSSHRMRRKSGPSMTTSRRTMSPPRPTYESVSFECSEAWAIRMR